MKPLEVDGIDDRGAVTTWPKIKLTDERGRTMTVFERQPDFDQLSEEESAADRPLRFDVLVDQPHETLQARRNQNSELVGGLAEYVSTFVKTNGRWPTTAGDADGIIAAIEDLGFSVVHESEVADIKRATIERIESDKGIIVGAAEGQSAVYVDVEDLIEHLAKHGDLNMDDVSVVAHMIGEPRGASHWVATPKPLSKKARAHLRAALDKDGYIAGGGAHSQPQEQFDGVKLPAWSDVQRVLDHIAVHGASGDIIVMTVAQLRALVQRLC